jgi:processive 1,2-diacylglycerol beta-glucosyltransferase
MPGFGRFHLPSRLATRLRTRLRAQRRLWLRRWHARSAAGGAVLFPPVGRGAVAIETLAGSADPQSLGPRIAILHATAGSGHKRAAESIAAAISQQRPDALVREVDTLLFASRFYRDTYAASYNVMAARAPALWAALYHSWEKAPVNRSTAPVRLALDRLNLRRLARVLDREKADAVVCTHFLPVEVLSPRRGGGQLRVPLFCVITDFTAHPFWAFPHVDRYFVASDQVADELHHHGVPTARIEVTGIPVESRFSVPIGREAARARCGLDPARPAVLVMGGGAGVGPLAELAQRLAALPAAPQVTVVCGTNAALQREVARLPAARDGRVTPLGYTREVDALLESCDVAVSKAGGLTCSEALIKRTPLVFFRPTPGQEVRNAEFLVRGGAAVHAETIGDVESAVSRLLGDPRARQAAREACGRLAHPDAAAVIASRVLSAAAPSRRGE